jgi:hypothetical protein
LKGKYLDHEIQFLTEANLTTIFRESLICRAPRWRDFQSVRRFLKLGSQLSKKRANSERRAVEDKTHLLRFYAGTGPDDRGRFLREIHQWPDDELEHTHDYIQWLFPLAERSGFNPEAPTLDANNSKHAELAAVLQFSERLNWKIWKMDPRLAAGSR